MLSLGNYEDYKGIVFKNIQTGSHYVNIFMNYYRLDLIIDKTTITKLSGFVVNGISNDLQNLKASFNVTLPEIDLQGQYIAGGELQGLINITGNGSYTYVHLILITFYLLI